MGEPAFKKYSYDEYLAIERECDRKHEFIDGDVYAMAGGTPAHGALACRMSALVGRSLGTGPCLPYSSDVKVWVSSERRATYADLLVVCGPVARSEVDRDAITNPTLIVEVLSDSTEADDRGGKFAAYAKLSTLREYVLVDQHEARLEQFVRNNDGSWTLFRHGAGDTVRLRSIDAGFTVDEVYAGIELEPETRKARRPSREAEV